MVSTIGFGASPFGDVFRPVSDGDCQAAVDAAIEGGINLFDVSPYYGQTLAEERLGKALRGHRQAVYLATKCGRYGTDQFDFSRPRLLQSIDESLNRLQTDHVDLLQAHDIEFVDQQQIVEETIPALLEIKAAGKTRFIGVSSYQLRIMASLAETQPIDTVLSYCRCNLLADDLNRVLLPSLQAAGSWPDQCVAAAYRIANARGSAGLASRTPCGEAGWSSRSHPVSFPSSFAHAGGFASLPGSSVCREYIGGHGFTRASKDES